MAYRVFESDAVATPVLEGSFVVLFEALIHKYGVFAMKTKCSYYTHEYHIEI